MKSKIDINGKFIMTKQHSIPYYEHIYAISILNENDFDMPTEDFGKIFENFHQKFKFNSMNNIIS